MKRRNFLKCIGLAGLSPFLMKVEDDFKMIYCGSPVNDDDPLGFVPPYDSWNAMTEMTMKVWEDYHREQYLKAVT